MHMPSPNTVAPAQGLYQPDEFKDNCGFGLIAHMQDDASHDLVKTAMHSLSCMTHRGGIAADGKTGDGCGLLLAMPKQFFREEAKKLSDITLSEVFAVGTVFLSLDPAIAAHAKQILTKKLNLKVAEYWRGVWSRPITMLWVRLRCSHFLHLNKLL